MSGQTTNSGKKTLYGEHTRRSLQNFPFTGHTVPPELIHAYGAVKKACLVTCRDVNAFDDTALADALIIAADEVYTGLHDCQFPLDMLQGGAGTSLNMNINEVIASRAQELLPDGYRTVSPLDDVNRYQSTNDTFPTAVKYAAILLVQRLEGSLVMLHESFQKKEHEFADITKIGRTQMQDAVLTTLGREFGCYAEAIGRDRWRVFKCIERLRTVNLGGTAIGTGINAERTYILRVTETLREITGVGFARSENLMDTTQNCDVFAEVSGILCACGANLSKISNDLRLLSSGPDAGFGEIELPKRQGGSTIMPGKVNPVIPEAVIQAAMLAGANHTAIVQAVSSGSLELNPFLPLVAYSLLDSIRMLADSAEMLSRFCIDGITACRTRIEKHLESATSVITAFVRDLGYEKCSEIATRAREENRSVREILASEYGISDNEYRRRISSDDVLRLGFKRDRKAI
ncbi:MAG: aspartate ammonia-lyase [Spirochaetota bacterium]